MVRLLFLLNGALASLTLFISLFQTGFDASVIYALAAMALYTVIEVFVVHARMVNSTKLLLWTLNLFCSVLSMLMLYLTQLGWSGWLQVTAMAVTGACTILTAIVLANAEDPGDTDDFDEASVRRF